LRVAGADHLVPEQLGLYSSSDRESSPAALVITSGLMKTYNEDAGGWERFDRRAFYAVADAHFGEAAAVIAVDTCLTFLSRALSSEEQFQPERFRSSFQRSLALTEARILRQEGASSSETTLLALAIGWGRVFWGSFGDSRLYAEPRSEQINPADGNYLGGTARSVSILAGAMSWGELEGSIAQDRRCRLMLCTDGVPESGGIAAEEWDPQAICSILAAASDVTSAAANLAKAALDRGGSDNLCAIVLDLPRSSG